MSEDTPIKRCINKIIIIHYTSEESIETRMDRNSLVLLYIAWDRKSVKYHRDVHYKVIAMQYTGQ